MSSPSPDLPVTSLVLSREEVLAVLHLIGLSTIPGLGEEPIANLTAEQQAFGLIVAERALRARGLAVINEEGRLLVQSTVLQLVAACAFPAQSLYVTRIAAPGGVATQLIAHQREGLWAIHDRPESVLHAFQAAERWSVVWDVIRSFCGWPNQRPNADGVLTVVNQTLATSRELATSGRVDEARLALLATGNRPDAVERMIDLLAHAHTVSVVQHVKPSSPDAVAIQSVTTLHRGDMLLVAVEPADGEAHPGGTTVIQPASIDDLERLLNDLVGSPTTSA